MILKPKMTCHGNVVVIDFVTRFGVRKFLHFFKKSGEFFRLTYTGVDTVAVLAGQIKTIWKNCVDVYTTDGVKRAVYGNNFMHGEEVFVIEYDSLERDLEYHWVVLKEIPDDIRCVNFNIDVHDNKTQRRVRRFQIDPFLGNHMVVQ